MSETLDNTTEQKKQRPTFLTVLCILSFIGAGIVIIALLLGAVAGGVVEAGAAQAEANGAEVTVETSGLWTLLIVQSIITAASLVGVIKMWRLQKQGYFIYVGASVAGIIAGVVLTGVFSVTSLLFPVLFIVLYGLNLKHME